MSRASEEKQRLAVEKILRHLVKQHGRQKVKDALASLDGPPAKLHAYKWHGPKRRHCQECGAGPVYGFRIYTGNLLLSHCCFSCADAMEGVVFHFGLDDKRGQ